jgi:hypothetical protein
MLGLAATPKRGPSPDKGDRATGTPIGPTERRRLGLPTRVRTHQSRRRTPKGVGASAPSVSVRGHNDGPRLRHAPVVPQKSAQCQALPAGDAPIASLGARISSSAHSLLTRWDSERGHRVGLDRQPRGDHRASLRPFCAHEQSDSRLFAGRSDAAPLGTTMRSVPTRRRHRRLARPFRYPATRQTSLLMAMLGA